MFCLAACNHHLPETPTLVLRAIPSSNLSGKRGNEALEEFGESRGSNLSGCDTLEVGARCANGGCPHLANPPPPNSATHFTNPSAIYFSSPAGHQLIVT